ncbi:conserved hypothetical protein [Bacillus mycoides]|uniref:Uncharacterized protein n=1 Tax=Bacillus mycoides TaxID=1405 RepID=A0A654C7N1_BACMY|nr:conserved hypothetical protein [Bacillus mycoides]
MFSTKIAFLFSFLTFLLPYINKLRYNKTYSYNNLLLGGVMMPFAAWSAIFMTLIGAMSGAIFGTHSYRKSKNTN